MRQVLAIGFGVHRVAKGQKSAQASIVTVVAPIAQNHLLAIVRRCAAMRILAPPVGAITLPVAHVRADSGPAGSLSDAIRSFLTRSCRATGRIVLLSYRG